MINRIHQVPALAGAVLMLTTSVHADVPPGVKLDLAEPETRIQLQALDVAKLSAEDAAAPKGRPLRFGIAKTVELPLDGGLKAWQSLGDGRMILRARVSAESATSMGFGFERYWLPEGAELYVYDPAGGSSYGPYDDTYNPYGALWTPQVIGAKAMIEVVAPEKVAHAVQLELTTVQHGYVEFWKPDLSKSGSCNVDVICPEGDDFRAEIRSVAQYTFRSGGSTFVCTGQLMNNTSGDNTPYFLTANHCVSSQTEINTLVATFNYESATCRMPGSSASASPVPIQDFNDSLSGGQLIATSTGGEFPNVNGINGPDFTLIEFNQDPPESFGVHWAGWDHSGNAPGQSGGIFATSIHHPVGHAKRIAHTDQPLRSTGYVFETGGGTTHWLIRAWSVGTTEGGSSGSGLFDRNGRVIGMLSGGFASCSSDPAFCSGSTGSCDWYGRFSEAWDTGTADTRRLSDWLDPENTGTLVLDGTDGCEAPTLSLSSSVNPSAPGQMTTFSVAATGGVAPYTFDWDLDGDGATDSTDASVTASFPDALSSNVNVLVTDSANCTATASIGQVVQAPQVEVSSTGNGSEVCGDGDGNIEPGEFWSFPVTLRNNGSAQLTGGIASFGINQGDTGKRLGGPDGFGYSYADSEETACAFDYVDISNSGTLLSFDDLDDGGASVTLGGPGFNFYGTNRTSLTVSTNGYLAAGSGESGDDFSNDCPLPAGVSSGSDARLAVLHDDLDARTSGEVRHQYFTACPRPGDVPGSGGCNVFQWTGLDYFNQDSNVNMQAVIYDGSHEIVYQYLPGNQRAGDSQTVGIQGSATSGLTYHCDGGSAALDIGVNSNSAVCFFHPDSPGPQRTAENVVFDGPAYDVGNLGVNQSAQVDVQIQISPDFNLGDSFAIDYIGTAYDGGYSNTPLSEAVVVSTSGDGSAAACNSFKQGVQPSNGFWFNSMRSGNGIDLHYIGDQMYSAWFTAEPGRVPVWYYVQTINGQRVEGGQIRAAILRFTNQGTTTDLAPVFDIVGEAVFSFLTETVGVMSWTINGVSNGEKIVIFNIDTDPVDGVITDQWFNPADSGWGLGVHRQGGQEFSAVYLYGTQGEPRWVVTLDNALDDGDTQLGAFDVHCPGCAYINPTFQNAGTLTRDFMPDGTGTLDIDVNIGGDFPIQWQRMDLPVQQISPPGGR